jgi:linoleoyl-CoA desaturase
MAGARWKEVLAAGIVANLVRNLIVSGLQMGSSVGHDVSLEHDWNSGDKPPGEWCRFQVETSKNWLTPDFWKPMLGGLDRHIEHHLYSNLPPHRLHALSGKIRELCRKHGVKYHEYPSFTGTIRDSLSYLWMLSASRNR